jgi:hypothetical protein
VRHDRAMTSTTDLLRLELIGAPGRVETAPGSPAAERGIVGVDVRGMSIDGTAHTVVQVLFDDDVPGFERALLDQPLVAELRTPGGDVVVRDLFDHDRFRRDLHAEQQAGEANLRGVLVLPGGELPPHYIRLAFLPVPVDGTAGTTLAVVRTDVPELVMAVDDALEREEVSEAEHRALLTAIEQRHPA